MPVAVRNQRALGIAGFMSIAKVWMRLGQIVQLYAASITAVHFVANLEILIKIRVETADTTHINIRVIASLLIHIGTTSMSYNVTILVDGHRGRLGWILAEVGIRVTQVVEVVDESSLRAAGLGPEEVVGDHSLSVVGREGHIFAEAGGLLAGGDGGQGRKCRSNNNGHRFSLSTLVIVGHHGVSGIRREFRRGERVVVALFQRSACSSRSLVPFVRRERRSGSQRGGISTAYRAFGSQLERTDITHGLHHLAGVEHVIRAVAEGLVAVLNDIAAGCVI